MTAGAPAAVRPSGRAVLVAGLFSLAGIAVLIALAHWQAERLVWKEGLIADLDRRLAASPIPLPPPERWDRLDPARDEFTRVTFTAEWLPGREALVYTNGSGLRPDVSEPGYWVFAPARVDGRVVIVDRGFVPENRSDPKTRSAGEVAGTATLVGLLRWPEARGPFTPKDDPAHNVWFVRDQNSIALSKGWGRVAPFYIELEAPQPEGGLPRLGKLTVNLPNNHFQYELTWAGLAVVLAAVYGLFLLRWWRSERSGESSVSPP